MNNTETGCCPRFNPEPWNEKEITWENKLFVKDRVMSFWHIPLNFGSVMRRNMKKIDASIAKDKQDIIVLSDENSLWGADIYISVNKEIDGLHLEKVSGKFLTKVFEGSYSQMGKWICEMKTFLKSKGKEAKKILFFYTTCPKCAKVYGKNYVVLLAKIQ
ncbi:MAG: hydrolase [Bacteroidota bacterium]